MKLKPVKLSSLLSQVKDKHYIKNENNYKQVTVSNTWTISLREEKMWIDIWTKNQFCIKKWQFIYSRLWLHAWAFWIVPDSLDWAVVTWDMPVFEINNSKILTEFLILSLDGDFFRNQLNWLNKWVAQSRIRESILLNLKILLPETIKEQEEILSKYNEFKSNYDNLSEISSNNLNYIKNLKQSILGEAIEWKLTKSWREQNPWIEPASILLEKIKAEKEELVKEKKLKKQAELKEISKDEIPFEIPKTWNWCRLIDIFDVRDGTHDSPKYVPTWFPLITSKNLVNWNIDFNNVKYITEIDYNKIIWRSFVDDWDILFAMIWSIWNPVIVDKQWKKFWIKNVALFKYYNKSLINIFYLYYFLLITQYTLQEISKWWIQQFISLSILRAFPFPLPPLEEQKEIVRIIDELTKFCDELETQTKKVVEKSEKLYKSFINNIWEYSEDEIKELLENSKNIEENIKETVKNNLSFKNFEEFVAYIESLQKKEETKEVKKAKKQVYNIKSSNMEILEILKDNKDWIDPLSLWQFSKHKDSIEDFYDELKKLANEWKIKEEKWSKWDEERKIILKLAK